MSFNTLTVTNFNYKRINSINVQGMEKKTSQDYQKEINEAQDKVKRLENEISERLLQLSVMRPNVVLIKQHGVDVYARGLTRFYIDTLPINTRIQYIERFEEELAKENKYIQGRLF